MKTKTNPKQKDLRQFFDYIDGELVWKSRSSKRFNTAFSGKPAGCLRKDQGYVYIRFMQKQYLAHRLIYAWHCDQEFDDKQIDHIDGNKSNNRIENLRLASPMENANNRGKQKNNSVGLKGVTYNRRAKKYQAQIHSLGKTKYLGIFDSSLDAYAAYMSAAIKEHGKFVHNPINAMNGGRE
jgi:hypothetical protein